MSESIPFNYAFHAGNYGPALWQDEFGRGQMWPGEAVLLSIATYNNTEEPDVALLNTFARVLSLTPLQVASTPKLYCTGRPGHMHCHECNILVALEEVFGGIFLHQSLPLVRAETDLALCCFPEQHVEMWAAEAPRKAKDIMARKLFPFAAGLFGHQLWLREFKEKLTGRLRCPEGLLGGYVLGGHYKQVAKRIHQPTLADFCAKLNSAPFWLNLEEMFWVPIFVSQDEGMLERILKELPSSSMPHFASMCYMFSAPTWLLQEALGQMPDDRASFNAVHPRNAYSQIYTSGMKVRNRSAKEPPAYECSNHAAMMEYSNKSRDPGSGVSWDPNPNVPQPIDERAHFLRTTCSAEKLKYLHATYPETRKFKGEDIQSSSYWSSLVNVEGGLESFVRSPHGAHRTTEWTNRNLVCHLRSIHSPTQQAKFGKVLWEACFWNETHVDFVREVRRLIEQRIHFPSLAEGFDILTSTVEGKTLLETARANHKAKHRTEPLIKYLEDETAKRDEPQEEEMSLF